jgi:hypothetical protein
MVLALSLYNSQHISTPLKMDDEPAPVPAEESYDVEVDADVSVPAPMSLEAGSPWEQVLNK